MPLRSGTLGRVDWVLVLAGCGIGIIVGLTGMGGGALMTPMLVIFFGIPPLAAVSSDLVVSAIMKPVGGWVHIRRRTVHWSLVGWLCLGSVPCAFAGVLLLRALGDGERLQHGIKMALGVALLLAAAGLVFRTYTRMAEHAARRRAVAAGADPTAVAGPVEGPLRARPLPTVLIGALGGLIVGMTSVGSGSLIIIALLMLYPLLRPAFLVGTDLVQAVPLVIAAAIGHLLFGDFRLDLTASLLLGAVPGAWIGAQFSSRAPGGLVRRALTLVLLASALKLLGMPDIPLLVTLAVVVVAGSLGWMVTRRRHGLPALARTELRERQPEQPPQSGHPDQPPQAGHPDQPPQADHLDQPVEPAKVGGHSNGP